LKLKEKEITCRNFCEICGLKIRITTESKEKAKAVEELFNKMNTLGLREGKKYRRHVAMSNEETNPELNFTDFCSIDSKKWISNGEKCSKFILKLPNVSLSDYLSIHIAAQNTRLSNILVVFGIFVTAILSIILIL